MSLKIDRDIRVVKASSSENGTPAVFPSVLEEIKKGDKVDILISVLAWANYPELDSTDLGKVGFSMRVHQIKILGKEAPVGPAEMDLQL